MNENKLSAHLSSVHPQIQPSVSPKTSLTFTVEPKRLTPAPRNTDPPNRQRISPLASPQNPITIRSGGESRYDGSRGYHDFAREINRYGSHPLHDDYGDEANA